MNNFSHKLDLLASALTEHNPFMKTEDFADWFASRQAAHKFHIEQIPFDKLEKWSFEAATGNLRHASGKFYSIEGISVTTNAGPVREWSQPIINQPEVGILGILTKKFDGVLYFLMQTKMEPGNINMIQLAPTLQATRSNYTRVHGGRSTPYLEYFIDRSGSVVLVDALQSEQGARFLRKRNRNIIIETAEEIELLDDYCWLTLGQIGKLIQQDNIVNMDARTVLSCISFADRELEGKEPEALLALIEKHGNLKGKLSQLGMDSFARRMMKSELAFDCSLHTTDAIISWMTELKVRYELDVESIPLKFVKGWHNTGVEIAHDGGRFFSVIAVAVEADNREVPKWTQPVVKPQEEGIVAYLVKSINGVLHFLVQAKVEPGNFDVVEMAPSVQCITGSYAGVGGKNHPPFLDYVLSVQPENVHSSSMQSEEGGRFYREENRNIIIEVDEGFATDVPDNYIWVTMNQLKTFIRYNNFINVEGRCLLSCLSFI
jgi:oxidase EvaA